MARLKLKSAAAIGALTMDQVWLLTYGDIGMPAGVEFPFDSVEDARISWLRHRDALLATKFSTSPPLFGETEFDDAYAEEREERRKRLEERANAGR
jgi:hypothetical protein